MNNDYETSILKAIILGFIVGVIALIFAIAASAELLPLNLSVATENVSAQCNLSFTFLNNSYTTQTSSYKEAIFSIGMPACVSCPICPELYNLSANKDDVAVLSTLIANTCKFPQPFAIDYTALSEYADTEIMPRLDEYKADTESIKQYKDNVTAYILKYEQVNNRVQSLTTERNLYKSRAELLTWINITFIIIILLFNFGHQLRDFFTRQKN